MKFPGLGVFYIFLQFDLFQKAIPLKCQSPQYVIIGEEGTLECSFPAKFQAIVWYDSVNITKALVTKIEKQDTGKLKVSGDGYEGGRYDILLNGSLIIPSVTTRHDRTFKVILVDENLIVHTTKLVVTTLVHSSQTSPAINLCGSDDLCFVDLMEAGFLKCTFERARPAVNLTWYSRSDEGNEIRNTTSTIRKDGEYTFMSTATIDISLGGVTPLRVFTCEASGPALWFSKSSTFALVSSFQENIKYRNDNIIQITAILNTTLRIPCAKEGMPIAFVWSFERFKHSSHLVLSVNDNRKVINNLESKLNVFRNGSLNFLHVTRNLEGIFTCTYLTAHVSSVNMVRVTVVEYDQEESAQTFPTATVVIIIAIPLSIFGILLLTCCIRRSKLTARNKDKNNLSDDPSSQSMIESTKSERDKEDERTVEEKKDEKKEEGNDGDREEGEKMYRTTWGAAVSGVKFDHDDKLVNYIDEIELGDHIVLSSWLLHPRCHAIVVDKNEEEDKLLVIRFTYSKGVTEEWLPLKPPTYRVTRYYLGDKQLSESDCSSNSEVISRARSLEGKDILKYSIRKNSCKTFARWCKTGIAPAGRFGYEKAPKELHILDATVKET